MAIHVWYKGMPWKEFAKLPNFFFFVHSVKYCKYNAFTKIIRRNRIVKLKSRVEQSQIKQFKLKRQFFLHICQSGLMSFLYDQFSCMLKHKYES